MPGLDESPPNFTSILLRLAATVFLALVLLYNEYFLRVFAAGNALDPDLVAGIRRTQAVFLLCGLAMLATTQLVIRVPSLARFTMRPVVASIVLFLLTLLIPITIMELALRPFSIDRRKTTIFLQDPDLGWRLRPNHQGIWGDVRVAINGKGLRGPEVPYSRTPGSLRILYLGDSVTFGFRLPSLELTFPSRIQERIENGFPMKIETINAGVGGYSPWQEYLYLQQEGSRYEPDIVVLSFVLNDVTEKFRLQRFGGDWAGYQLAHSATSWFDRFATKTAVGFAIRQWVGRSRFGDDLQQGAVDHEALNDWSLIHESASPRVQRAWEITLENLEKIVRFCDEGQIALVILAFPSTYQFLDPDAYGIPQRILEDFGTEQGVEVVNLLPLLTRAAEERGESPFDYFLDENHPSARGNTVIADLVAPILASRLEAMQGSPSNQS